MEENCKRCLTPFSHYFLPMEKSTLTVYTASAGAGKTYTLAAEYIALLLKGSHRSFRNVLAVTFTNKATAEMKERILQYLYDMGHHADFATSDFFQTVKGFLREAGVVCSDWDLQERARRVLSELLHDFDNFRVETIDSFFQSLLTSLAHDLGLSATFRVELNEKEVIKKAIDRLIIKSNDNKEDLEAMLKYVEKKLGEDKNWDFRKDLQNFASRLLGEDFLQHAKVVASEMAYLNDYEKRLHSLRKECIDHRATAALQLSELLAEIPENALHGTRMKSLRSYLAAIFDNNQVEVLKYQENNKTLPLLLESADNWLKAAVAKKGEYVAEAEALRQVLQFCSSYYHKIQECEVRLEKLTPLRLLQAVSDEVNLLNEENNNFLLKNTPQLFAQLVKADADFVFERVGTRFHHIMIDEFQDTSRLQWENFKTLLLENTASGHKNMVVGDVKQSIYRWRNGDWRILGEIKKNAPFMEIEEKTLLCNHRSGRAIVEFNNAFFITAAEKLDRWTEAGTTFSDLYQSARQEVNPHKGEGYVRVALGKKVGRKEEVVEDEPIFAPLYDMQEIIVELHEQGMPYRDMAILVRSNSEATKIVEFFNTMESGIPLISPDAFLLSASPAVQMVIHALHTLNFQYKAEEKEKGKFQRAASMAYLVKEYQTKICHNEAALHDMMADAEHALPEAFVQERNALMRLPLFELCQRLIALFRVYEIKGQSPYLFFFLDCLKEYLSDNASSISAFLEYWEEVLHRQALPVANPEGVQVTTVHKSKGLAFPTVFVPFAQWELEKTRYEIIHWTQKTGDEQVSVIPINIQKKAVQATAYEEDYKAESVEMRIEELNAAYVAFTRPRNNLFIWCEVSKEEEEKITTPSLGDLLYHALPNEKPSELPWIAEWGELTVEKKQKKKEEQSSNPLEIQAKQEAIEFGVYDTQFEFKQSNDSHRYLLTEEKMEERHQKDYLLKGNLLHEVFARIHTIDDVRSVLESMYRQGLFSTQLEVDTLRALVEDSFSHALVRSWFDGSWSLFNECTILTREAGELQQYRPDRVMTKGEEAVVIDYKFGKPQKKYQEQVAKYMQLLQSMGYPCVTGYLWYVFSNEVASVTV